jgi:hypothetical protein
MAQRKALATQSSSYPVKTKAVRLEVKLPADNSSGLYEWEVK